MGVSTASASYVEEKEDVDERSNEWRECSILGLSREIRFKNHTKQPIPSNQVSVGALGACPWPVQSLVVGQHLGHEEVKL